MASPYFSALQSGGLRGDMSRQRGRMGMLANRARPRIAAPPGPVGPTALPAVGPGGGGFMSPLVNRLRSVAAPAIQPSTGPMIGAMPAGPELAQPGGGNFSAMAPAVQGSLMGAMRPQPAVGGGGGVFGKLAGSIGQMRSMAPQPEVAQVGGGLKKALGSFGGGFTGGSFPTGGFTGRGRRGDY